MKTVLDIETWVILNRTGLLFAGFYAVMTGASTSFSKIYHFNDIHVALMYLPIGGGGIVLALTSGRILDWNYRRHAKHAGLAIVKTERPCSKSRGWELLLPGVRMNVHRPTPPFLLQ
ncbi:Major facilitator superfamily domain general substrate transporter [Penicillium bovifimosum]|uniref:Major facilitator superfamily domain general substrate transporter n=1 Tax=Penicillium bovifimosum TaxID=126998 RepID=A0A9W9HD58_9EURO|nr:Major facilitator superfamily domain general substrate transporter [Penicillium bovifimosum]KAJ5143378.1 Major facilitator superfamily domain general substrate transporter [Penicillium bovifimosum]